MGLRKAREQLPVLVDRASQGSTIILSRRGRPLAALISTADYELFQELTRRDEGLRAVPRGAGLRVSPWTTPKILEVLARLGVAS